MPSANQPRILLICGSMNQTTQMHAIARELKDCACYFTPFYGDGALQWWLRLGLLESTILGHKLRDRCLQYLRDHDLPLALDGAGGPFSLVVSCTDLLVQRNIRATRRVIVQEGMTDPETPLSRFIQRTGLLPRWASSTTLTGVSGDYDRFCVASEGYKRLFVQRGAPESRLVVTGIPNFDDCRRYRDNHLPYRDYVLLCTTDMRETLRYEDRPALLRRVRQLAGSRPLHIKLHPNEDRQRAQREFASHCPDAIVHYDESAEHLVANCSVLVTQYSSVAYIGLALGKEVHSYFNIEELRGLLPIQNGGRSAANIAGICRELIEPAARTTATKVSTTPSPKLHPQPMQESWK